MFVETQSVTRWSFGRLIDGMGPIRIAIPAWRLPRDKVAAKAALCVSQAELLDIFHSELRPAKRIAKQPDTDFTQAENIQRQCMARLRTALYAS
jgi:hypothetical protein